MPGIMSGLRRAKSAARKYVFGERGRWSHSGTRRLRTHNGKRTGTLKYGKDMRKLNANRTHLGRLKNWLGLKIFGSRNSNTHASSKRKLLGRAKNYIEKMLGLRSRNNRNVHIHGLNDANAGKSRSPSSGSSRRGSRPSFFSPRPHPSPPSFFSPHYVGPHTSTFLHPRAARKQAMNALPQQPIPKGWVSA
jgi:hypothetical protein